MGNLSTVFMELDIIFDNNYNVYNISEVLSINAYDCKNKSETRKDPFSNDNLPGYWSYKTDEILTCYVEDVIKILIEKFQNKIELINKIVSENNGIVKINIVTYMNKDTLPAFYFNREFINFISKLNAEVEMDLY